MSSYVGNFGDSFEEQLKRRLANVPLPNFTQEAPRQMTEREQFEAWFQREYQFDREAIAEYRGMSVPNLMFSAYQFGRASQQVPEGMLSRIEAAIDRIQNNHAPRRIPADPTDVDLVLAEVRAFLTGNPAPFWVAAPPDCGSC